MGLVDELEEWLKAGHDPNMLDGNGMYPLAWACKKASLRIVEMLIAYGAKAGNCRINHGDTCLSYAIGFGNSHISQILLENGADPNIKDANDNPPLHCALKYDRLTSVKMLLDHNARVDITFGDGLTPLGLAAQHNSFDSAMFLVRRLGLNPYQVADKLGQNAIEIARSSNYEYLADAMEIHARYMLMSCAQSDQESLFSTDMVSDCTEQIGCTFASQIYNLRSRAYDRQYLSIFAP